MAEREIDALIIRGHSGFWYGFMGDLRYVTGVNGHEGYCVFPKEGEPTVFLWFPPAALWSVQKQQSWVKDVRGGGWPFGAAACGERVKELGYGTGRIGIVGLPGEREPEGIFSHGAYLDVEKTLPEATLLNATDIIEKLRWIKSEEEIECHTRAAEIGDLAIEAMGRSSKPGVSQAEVYGEMVRVMLANGSEPPTMLLWDAAPMPQHAVYAAPDIKLNQGDVVINEISPKYCGYYAPSPPAGVRGKTGGRVDADVSVCVCGIRERAGDSAPRRPDERDVPRPDGAHQRGRIRMVPRADPRNGPCEHRGSGLDG